MKRKDTLITSEQAVSVVVGALLVLSIMIIAAVQYQNNVIPAQEEETEFQHNREVRGDLQQLRSNIIATSSSGQLRTSSVAVGTRFEQQFIFGFLPAVHSPNPAGTLEMYNVTEDATGANNQNITITGADGQGGASNYWQASEEYNFNTSFLNYNIDYSRYQQPPTTYYENSIIYEEVPRNGGNNNTVIQSNQNIVQGKNVNLITLSGDLGTTTTQTINVQSHPVSAPSQTITVYSPPETSGGPFTVTIPTNISSEEWCTLDYANSTACNGAPDGEGMLDGEYITQGGYITNINYTSVAGEPNVLELKFQEDETFTLQLSKVHLQSQSDRSAVPITNSSYVAWRGSDRINFRENSRQAITAQVRDKFNNPVEGVDTVAVAFRSNNEDDCIGDFVSGQLGGITGCPDERQPGERTSGQDGAVTFFYDTPQVQDDTSINLQVELAKNSNYASFSAPPTTFQLSGQGTYSAPELNQEVTTSRETGDTIVADLGNPNGIQYQYEPVESTIDSNRTLRVLDARLNKSSVIEGKRVSFRLILDNTGINDTPAISFAPTITNDAGNPVTGAVIRSPPPLQLQAGEQYRTNYEFEFDEPGNYTIEIANTNVSKEIEVVPRTSTVYDGNVQSSVERQSVAKIVTSYKDQIERSDQSAWNSAIPPVVESSDGTFISDAEGLIYDFGDARTADDNSLSLESNETLDRMNLGTAFQNVPQQNHYTLQLNYEIESDDPSQPVELLIVEKDGSVIDPNTSYQIKGDEPRQTRYFTLSQEESDYIRDHKNIYVVFTAEGDHTVDLYYYQVISSNRILDLSSANTQVTDVQVEGPSGTPKTDFAQGSNLVEPIYVKVTKENTGSQVAERSISLEIDGEIVSSRQVTINPQSSVTETFVRYGVNTTTLGSNPPQNTYPQGYYLISSESAYPTQIKVGDPSGSGNFPPVAKISTGIPRVNDVYVPTGDTAADDLSTTFTLTADTDDPNNDPLTHTWQIRNKNTGVLEVTTTGDTIDENDFPGEGYYEVTLNSSDGTATDEETIEVALNGLKPNVQILANPNPAPAGTEIQLDASQSVDVDGTINEYRWKVNGSVVAITSNPFYSQTYPDAADYTVGVVAVDDDGNTYERTTTLSTFDSNVVANYDYTPTDPTVLDEIRLNASSSTAVNGSIESYTWYTNGSFSGNGEINYIDINEQGPKNVTLVIEGTDGSTAQTSKTIVLGAPFEAVIDAQQTDAEIGQTIGFDSYETTDPNGAIEEIEWTMGDNTTYDNTQQIAHEYNEPGTYTVTLTIRGGGYEDTDTVQMNITAVPPIAIAQFDDTIFLSETVSFYGEESYHPEGYINFYSWDMDDGSSYSTTNVLDHRFPAPTENIGLNNDTLRDPYQPELVVTGNYGLTDNSSVNVTVQNRGPYNDYTITTDGPRPNNATSQDYSGWVSSEWELNGTPSYHFERPVEDIAVYRWEVTDPDGQTDVYTGEIVTRKFTKLGNYTVKYAIRDQYGYWNNSTFTFNVDARPPEASFVYTPQDPGPSEPVDYDGSSSQHNEPDGNIQSYEWDFDDGSANNTGETTTHTFFGSGSQYYNVTLTVTDQWGQTDSVTKTILTDPYQSCHDLLINRENADSGYYPIDPDDDNGNTFQVYCDMDTEGGGWTLIDKDTARDFANDVGASFNTNGNVIQSGVSRTEAYSLDGGGDHYTVYRIYTGFRYTEMRLHDMQFGSTSYRGSGATSEVRGSNTAKSEWNDLNSGGVSGEVAFGTANSVLDSYSRSDETSGPNNYPIEQRTGSSANNGDPFANNYGNSGKIYYTDATSVAVGWGESGGQEEGWEWETGGFYVRRPVGTLTYFYDTGNNIKNFGIQDVDNGNIQFQSNEIDMQSNSGTSTITNGDSIDLSRYNTIYLDYVLTNQNGGDGSVTLNVNGRTASDNINNDYLVNDGTLEIDVSDMSDTTGNLNVDAYASGSDTTVQVKRIWGREGGAAGATTLYNTQFNSDTDGWNTETGQITTRNGWLTSQCNSGYTTNNFSKSFSPNLDASTIEYDIRFAGIDSWDSGQGDDISVAFRDDSGWNTVETVSPQWDGDTDTNYDCDDANYKGEVFRVQGTFNVDGTIQEVRILGTQGQDDYDESIGIDYITIERV